MCELSRNNSPQQHVYSSHQPKKSESSFFFSFDMISIRPDALYMIRVFCRLYVCIVSYIVDISPIVFSGQYNEIFVQTHPIIMT